MLTRELFQKLAQYDSPTVCNAIELWDLRSRTAGYMNETIQACYPHLPPMVGLALTTTFRSAAAPIQGDAYSSLTAQTQILEQMELPAVMVFQDLDQPVAAATFGEVMCTTYKAFGAAGLITSGTGRDLEQVERLDFPAFTAGAQAAHGYCHFVDLQIPVSVGGIMVRPNELLHGDCNGVTTIPVEIASEIPGVCDEIISAENLVLDYLKAGNVTAKGFDEARQACGAQIQALSRRLKGK
ncbi:MAG: RraA family protein [Planctomycetaceae bacterium]|nr:RraA family protein [Planctomycetaceae bacterium]